MSIPVYIHLTLKGHIVNNSKFREKYGSWAIVSGAANGIGRAVVDELILVTTMPLLIIITIATFAMIRVPMNRLSGAILFGFFGLFIYQLTL